MNPIILKILTEYRDCLCILYCDTLIEITLTEAKLICKNAEIQKLNVNFTIYQDGLVLIVQDSLIKNKN